MPNRLLLSAFLVALIPGVLGALAGTGLHLDAPRLFWGALGGSAAWMAGLVAFDAPLRRLFQGDRRARR